MSGPAHQYSDLPAGVPGGALPSAAVVHPRRQFLALASGCLLCATAGRPRARAGTDRPVDVGPLAGYPRDVISEEFIQYDLFVIRHRGKLFACTAVCPHKANALLRSPQKPDTIVCSGHDSDFTPEGLPRGGPARRALVRYGISLTEKGRIMVDTSREFPQARWNDKSSYLEVGA